MIAHEYRNVLSVVQLGLSALGQNPSPDRQARALAMLDRQTDLLARLTDDLASGAVLAGGDGGLRLERGDLRSAVATALEPGRRLVEAAGHQLAVHLPDDPIPVQVDVNRLTQVMTNLLANAAKYTGPGGRVAVAVASNRVGAIIRVTDTGDGLAADHLKRVFEPFVRGPATPGRVRNGSGIGLAVVRHLVEAHGGAVWAESDGPGRGSTFVVRLPSAAGDS